MLSAYIDAHYRTIPNRTSRGLVGHSMGGYGASRIGMKHPDVFGALYIMSPCCMSSMAGGGPGPADQIKERAIASEKKVAAAKSPADLAAQSPGFAAAQYATAAAWAPNPKNPPLYFDLPTKDGVPQPEIVAKYAANSPLAFVDQYIGNLKQYRAISMDVGDQDGLRFDATKLHDDSRQLRNRKQFRDLLRYARQRSCRSLPEPCSAVLQQESLLHTQQCK